MTDRNAEPLDPTEIADLVQSLLGQPRGTIYSGRLSVTYERGCLLLSEYRPGGDGWEAVGIMTNNPQYICGWLENGHPIDDRARAAIMGAVARWLRAADAWKTRYGSDIARDLDRGARSWE